MTQDQAARATALLALFASENPRASLPPLPGERLLSGVAASPGRAVGPARLGLANRHPDDVEGAIIVSPSITPGDGAFLVKSAGVVSTGGGALSHAGLLALQYGKPALVVSGAWHRANGSNLSTFAYRTVHYDERVRTIGGYRVTERHHLREREELLHEGDLVVLDADGSLLRILGQERDALSLHDSLQQLELANRQLAAIAADTELLVARGRRLRARHQLEKILVRLTDPILACHAVGEMVLRDSIASPVPLSEQAQLLALLLRNPAVGETVRTTIAQVIGLLSRRRGAAMAEARRVVAAPSGVDVPAWRLLTLRLDVLHLESLLTATHSVAVASGAGVEIAAPDLGATGPGLLDEPIRQELLKIRATLVEKTRTSDVPRLRHLIDELDRIDSVLGTDTRERAVVARLHHNVVVHDREVERTVAGRRIVTAAAGGIELRDVAGNKAANLAQVALLGEGAFVPPWFVVTDVAFRQALRAPLVDKGASAGQTARQAIESIVARPDLTNAQKAAFIRHVWECVDLPDDLVTDVRQAYRAWCEPDHAAPDSRPFSPAPAGEKVAEGRMRGNAAAADPFVAVRSSASEEDLEAAARAGEFDTFLFVRGEEALIAHLRRAWSGLWSERALHSRSLLGTTAGIGGGVLVQKMIDSRASGVLHTVNIAERRLREMVINAGLGLGEGIVSGTVASDRIIVSKEGDLQHGELHFRYLTADKRERVVFNSRVGSGTARVETLYHQRLRPALEYVEICELVRAAARLEEAYGYPLDIEFAVEGTSLYLLQVRPIPTPLTVWRETVERWPLGVRTSSSAGAARPRAALEGNTEARGRAAEAGQNARTPKESS